MSSDDRVKLLRYDWEGGEDNFIFNNCKIIHSCKFSSSNLLLILEALLIKLNKPRMNSGLKASKELSLFV